MAVTLLDLRVDVRREGDEGAPIVATLARGDEFELNQSFWSLSEWTEIRLKDGQPGFIPGATKVFHRRVVRTLGDKVPVRAGPSPIAEILSSLSPGAQITLVRPAGEGEEPWLEITDVQDKPGYISGNSLVEPVVQHRFCVERATFIAVVALVVGTIIGLMQSEVPIIGAVAMVGFLVFGFYFTAGYLTETNWFWDAIPIEDEMPPAFDWTRMVLEPLFFLGALVLVVIAAAVAAVVRWAFSAN